MDGLSELVTKAAQLREGVNLCYQVKEPQHYGVIEFDEQGQVLSLEENRQFPSQKYAVTVFISMMPKWLKLPQVLNPLPAMS